MPCMHSKAEPPSITLCAPCVPPCGPRPAAPPSRHQEDKAAAEVTREAVASVLDGATPLHCAALRGNPAQVRRAAPGRPRQAAS